MDTYKEVIYECPDDTFLDILQDCVNENLDDKKDLNQVNAIGLDDKYGE